MSISLNISPRIIPNIASLYNDTNRIFMEYIDNSIDSAEEFYKVSSDSYEKNIEIQLQISNDQVIIKDNCYGITNFTKVVENVANSDKKEQPWTNGQFGYGIYSFMAACENLVITSKLKQENLANRISINRSQFNKDNQKDVVFDDVEHIPFGEESGTLIELNGFGKDMWKKIDIQELVDEINLHFERLLVRENLKITIDDKINNKQFICKSFDYEEYEGDYFETTITELNNDNGKVVRKILLDTPIKVYLKILKDKALSKQPVFISKGRRIDEIAKVNSFKSKNKPLIWRNPSITGYVDLGDFLDPTIARNDFRNNTKSKALYSYLEEIEQLILEDLQKINKRSESNHYRALEDRLNSALSKLARIDNLNYRTQNLAGNEINLKGGDNGNLIEQGFGTEHHREGEPLNRTSDDNESKDDPFGFGVSENPGEGLSNDPQPDGKSKTGEESDNPFEDSPFKGSERKKSGFNIEFAEGEPIINASNNKPLRSQLIGGTIKIFREHPDFIKRVKKSKLNNEPKISQRLITYLAGEITVHYKDKIQTRQGQPEYNISMFEDLVEFVYMFEDMVQDLEGTNLSEL